MKLYDMIQRFKIPSLQIPVVESLSSKLAQWRSTVKPPLPRLGKYLSNMPAKWKMPQFKLPKIKLPDFKLPTLPEFRNPFSGLNLKFKIPELGFPKLPPLPDIGGFFQGKVEDMTNMFQGIFRSIGGVAADWQAKRERKKTIRNIIIGLILLFIAALLWKRK